MFQSHGLIASSIPWLGCLGRQIGTKIRVATAEVKLTSPHAAEPWTYPNFRQQRLRDTMPATISINFITVHTFSPVRERDLGDFRILPT
ncbi:hypothetical protein J6590_105093, partial [Homalodisca vitripennis]